MKDLHIPRPRIEITRKSFFYKGAKVWNDIPAISEVRSPSYFSKGKLKTIFWDHEK